jgi:tetratricopeptide (TPR) repeat protein
MLYQRAAVLAAATPTVFNFVDNPLIGAHSLASRLTPVAVMAKYMWLLIWPAKLSCNYSFAQIPLATGTLKDWIAWLVVATVVAVVSLQFNRNRLCFFFGAFAFVVFAPVSNLFFSTGTIMAERFLYLPSLGLAACLVVALFAASQHFGTKLLAPVALVLIIAALAIRTWERNLDWQSDLTLWTTATKTSPNSAKVHSALAFDLNESDPSHFNISNVIEESDKALAILDPLPDSLNQLTTYVNGGSYYIRKGDLLAHADPDGKPAVTPGSQFAYQKALQILLRGVSINNAFAESYKQADLARGKPLSEIPPLGSSELFQKLSIVYQRLGDIQKASKAALEMRTLAPYSAESYLMLANTLMSSGRRDEAAVALVEASLISGNRAILGQLQKLYQIGGLDPQGCAIVQTPNGPILNVECAPVKKELCDASADLYKLYVQVRRPDLADQAKSAALRDFGCAADIIR